MGGVQGVNRGAVFDARGGTPLISACACPHAARARAQALDLLLAHHHHDLAAAGQHGGQEQQQEQHDMRADIVRCACTEVERMHAALARLEEHRLTAVPDAVRKSCASSMGMTSLPLRPKMFANR